MSSEQTRLLLLAETILVEVEECIEKIRVIQLAEVEQKLKRLKSQALEMSAKLMDS